jgi:signal transduction histidine kinase
VNVLPAVGEVADTLDRLLGARIRLTVEEPAEELWPTSVDLQAFELALLNLGINARDAMPNGGLLRFRVRNVTLPRMDRRRATPLGKVGVDRRGPAIALSGGDYVSVSVTDTGEGMDPETLSRAIQPFFTTKPRGKGTGLGLPMVHDFATQHGGALRLISRPGNGTTVEIWLPKQG